MPPGATNAISFWNVATKQLIFSVSTNILQVDAMAFEPSGKILAIGGRNGDLALIDAADGAEIRHFQPHAKRISQIVFSPDGETFLTASSDNIAKLWRTSDLSEMHGFAHANSISVVGFTDDGNSIFVGSYDYTANLWNTKDFTKVAEISGHTQPILSFAEDSSGKTFATGGADGLINIWDARSGKLLHTLTGNAGHVTALTFNPDKTRLASASKEGVIRLWKLDTVDAEPQQVLAFDAPAAVTNFIYFTPTENLLITSGISQNTHLWPATPIGQIRVR